MEKTNCKVVKGEYTGRVGYFTGKPNEYDLIMFYSREGKFPYRVCLHKDDVEVINV